MEFINPFVELAPPLAGVRPLRYVARGAHWDCGRCIL